MNWFVEKNDATQWRLPKGWLERGKCCRRGGGWLLAVLGCFLIPGERSVKAQSSALRYGEGIPPAVRRITERALDYLATTQLPDGSWAGSQNGAGVTGICVMGLMASGEDPDFGPYAQVIRRALRRIILDQDATTGLLTGEGHGSMYHHGFAQLALSEAYGVVNERLLWEGTAIPVEDRRSIAEALELAIRCVLTAQRENAWKAWRYSPGSTDADTTVSGTVLMGLLGARNSGIEIPDEAIEEALGFFRTNTGPDGNVAYQPGRSHGDGITRTAIATLVYAVAKRKHSTEYQRVAESIRRRAAENVNAHPFYYRYYMAQALFQSDLETWKTWNQRITGQLQQMQAQDGSFASGYGKAYATGMSVLALALNYRLLPVYER